MKEVKFQKLIIFFLMKEVKFHNIIILFLLKINIFLIPKKYMTNKFQNLIKSKIINKNHIKKKNKKLSKN